MDKCAAIKANGQRCQAGAIPGEQWCWNHHPDNAAVRKANAQRGGKRGGRGRPVSELTALRTENAELRDRMLKGELDPRVVAVAVQSINVDIRCLDTFLKAREQEELVSRMEEIEARLGTKRRKA
jgi:hypothetical protein